MAQVHFRCKSCGHLENSDHAAENDTPHACSVCSGGVIFTSDKDKVLAELQAKNPGQDFKVIQPLPGYFKIIDHTNWEVLADAKPERLKELDLKPEVVSKHKKWTQEESKQRDPKMLNVTAVDGPGTTDGAGAK